MKHVYNSCLKTLFDNSSIYIILELLSIDFLFSWVLVIFSYCFICWVIFWLYRGHFEHYISWTLSCVIILRRILISLCFSREFYSLLSDHRVCLTLSPVDFNLTAVSKAFAILFWSVLFMYHSKASMKLGW